MAPAAAKIGVTLRKETDGAAGAEAMGPEAEKHQKTKEDQLGYKISNNIGDRHYPKRGGSKRKGREV
jgi:hypothetical protein